MMLHRNIARRKKRETEEADRRHVAARPEPAASAKEVSKREVSRMNVAGLRKLAKENGIDGADGMQGTDLKRLLTERLRL